MARALTLAISGAALAVAATATPGAQDLTRADADSMGRKLTAIVLRSNARPATAAPVQTSFTEREVNAYLRFLGKDELPTGLVNPRLTIGDAGRVDGQAIVDLDAVRMSKPRGLLDPANLLMGSVEVRVGGRLAAANGQGVLEIDSATVGGIAVSKSILQQIVSYYTKTPDHPDGFDLDKPFTLPAGIRSVETRRGGATVVQ